VSAPPACACDDPRHHGKLGCASRAALPGRLCAYCKGNHRERRAYTVIAELVALVPSANRDRAELLAEELFGRGYAVGKQVAEEERKASDDSEDGPDDGS
jgi:predicted naringenin-chalcone synthase